MKVAIVRNISKYSEQINSEIIELATAMGYEILLVQKVDLFQPHPKQFLPEKKLDELKLMTSDYDIQKVIFSDQLIPKQLFKLEEELELDVIDKPMLILEIFEKKANSKDIIMQVQLARLKYNLPRLVTKIGEAVQSEKAGFGGTGEQVTDTAISDMKRRIKNLEKKLRNLGDKEDNNKKLVIPQLPIVGHYSTGKTTLFNMLTDASREVSNEAFTTMIMKTSRSLVAGYPIDLIDTVGLVDLPKNIISAFDLMLKSIFSFSGMVLCLDVSRELNQWKTQLEDYRAYLKRFSDIIPRILIALTKTDITDIELINSMIAHIEKQDWLEDYEIIQCRSDKPEVTLKRFVKSFESLFADKLTEFFYQNITPSAASKFHDSANIQNQEWHNDGTTSIRGVIPTLLLDSLKEEIFE